MLCRASRTWRDEDEADDFMLTVPQRFFQHPSEKARRAQAIKLDAPPFPPAAPALLSALTDPTRTYSVAAPAGGNANGTRARGSDDPADDDDTPDELRPRSKARPSPPSHFR